MQKPSLHTVTPDMIAEVIEDAPTSPAVRTVQPDEIEAFLDDEEAPKRTALGTLGDVGITAVKAAISLPEMAVGLLDIPTGGRVGKGLESVGFRPGEAKDILNDFYSPAQKAAFQRVHDAEGIVDTTVAAFQSPSVIRHTVLESLPATAAGGVAARGLGMVPKLAKLGAPARASIGEGLTGAGAAAEQARHESEDGLLSGKQAAASAASGIGTGAFGYLGGRIAQKLGIGDIDVLFAGGNKATAETNKGIARKVIEGMASEGFLEELPQSVQEQLWANYGAGRPLFENTDQAAVLGTLAGMVMGGTVAPLAGGRKVEDMDLLDSGQPAANLPQREERGTPERMEQAAMLRRVRANSQHETSGEYLIPEVERVMPPQLPAPAQERLSLPAPTTINLPGVFPMGGPNTYDPRGSLDEAQAPVASVNTDGLSAQPEAQAGPIILTPEQLEGMEVLQPEDSPLAPSASTIDLAAHEAATSPLNDRPEPSEEQKKAGNYKVGRVRLHGLEISIENPKGSIRSGTAPDGTRWETEMKSHYGYIKGTVGKDKDHLDIFLTPEAESADRVFVVDQIDPKTGRFDEHKLVMGPASTDEARSAYLANYDETGEDQIGAVTEMPMADFKAWLKSGKTTKPVGKLSTLTDQPETGQPKQSVTRPVRNKNEQDWEFTVADERFVTFRNPPGAGGVNGWYLARYEVARSSGAFEPGNANSSKGFVYVGETREEAIEKAKEWQRTGRGMPVPSGNSGPALYSGIPVDALVQEIRKLAGNVKAATPKLMELGQHVIEEGHRTLDTFTSRMKQHLGDMYGKFKGVMVQVFTHAKSKLKEERGSFSTRGTTVVAPPVGTPAESGVNMREFAHKTIDRVREIFDSPGGLGALPNFKEYLTRRYRVLGTLSEIKDLTHDIYQTFKGADQAAGRAIYEYMTTADADVNTIPEAYRRQAERAKQTVMDIGDKLVAYGLLDAKTMEANRGAYLPRVYLKHILGEDTFKALGTGKKLDLNYLKKRKDIPEDVRRFILGEIKDPAYLISRAVSLPSRDMAIIDWLADIARHSEWVLPKTLIEWSIHENPMRKWGKLEYRRNDDGTFDVTRNDVRTVETKHRRVQAGDLKKLLGDEELAQWVSAGKGKKVLRKDGEVYRETPWRKIGHATYRVNHDGTFRLKIKEKVRKTESRKGLAEADLPGFVGEGKAQEIMEGKGRAISGKMVTPHWLMAEAERIQNMLPHLPEADRAGADAISKRMRNAAQQVLGEIEGDALKDYRQIPDTTKYGQLRGMYVRKEIHNDLVESVRVSGEISTAEEWFGAGGKISRLNSWWKWSKVAADVTAWFRNFGSNAVLLHLSGVPFHMVPVRIGQAVREIRNNGKYWKIAKSYGVKESSFSNMELARIEKDLIAMEAKTAGRLSWPQMKVLFANIVNTTGDIYQFLESLGKTAKIIDAMERQGKSASAAAMEAHKWLFDYSLVGASTKFLRSKAPVGVPFITFTLKVLPRLAEVAVKTPWRFAPYVAMSYAVPALVASMLDIDDDDLDALKKMLPEWIQKKQHVYVLPVRDESGRWQVVDLGYFFPWTQWTEFGEKVARGEIGKGLESFAMMVGGPLPDLLVAVKTNTDPFTGREIADKTATPAEQLGQILGYLYNMAAPPFLSSRGAAGKLLSAIEGETDRHGNPAATYGQAATRLVGVNTYAYDPTITREQNIDRMRREVADIKTLMKQELRAEPDPARREQIREKHLERIQERNREILKYASESLPKGGLR